jgi:hypothetical protein
MPMPPLDPNAMTPELRQRLAQLLARQQGYLPPGAPLPPSGGFTSGVERTLPNPNAGASNMSIQPGRR